MTSLTLKLCKKYAGGILSKTDGDLFSWLQGSELVTSRIRNCGLQKTIENFEEIQVLLNNVNSLLQSSLRLPEM